MAGWIEPGVVFSGVEISAPGSGPILFGNLRSTYTIVDRQATTVLHGPIALASAICSNGKPVLTVP